MLHVIIHTSITTLKNTVQYKLAQLEINENIKIFVYVQQIFI